MSWQRTYGIAEEFTMKGESRYASQWIKVLESKDNLDLGKENQILNAERKENSSVKAPDTTMLTHTEIIHPALRTKAALL